MKNLLQFAFGVLYFICPSTTKAQCISNDTIANQQTVGNFSLCGAIPCETLPCTDGVNATFYTSIGCRKIASIRDSVDGINLGNVTVCETIDCSQLYYESHPFLNRRFGITPTTNGKAYVCFYILAQDIADLNSNLFNAGLPLLNPLTNLVITKVNGGVIGTPGSLAITIPNSAITATYQAATTVWSLCFPVDSFSNFYIHTLKPSSIALPVDLLSFSATKRGEKIDIHWETINEINNQYFILEYSLDGISFSPLSDKIESKTPNGNSSSISNYQFTHLKPQLGNNYYRLKQIDLDGNFSYSHIAQAEQEGENEIQIYPNPVNEELNIEVSHSKSEKLQIQMFNTIGYQLRNEMFELKKGNQTLQLNTSNLSKGLYFIRITNDTNKIRVLNFYKN